MLLACEEFESKIYLILLYGLSFVHGPLFSRIWWTESPIIDPIFRSEIRNVTHFVFLISSVLFIFLIRKEWFITLARIGAISVILSMLTFLISKNANIQMASAIVMAIALGSVFIGIFIPYVFALNNTEKIFAVVGSNILINLLLFLQVGGAAINLTHQ